MGKHSKKASVRSYTKSNGTKVRGHSRKTTWTDSRKAAAAAGTGGLVFILTAFELGFEAATVLLLVVGAVVGILFTVVNGGQRGSRRGKSVTRRILAPQNKKSRPKSGAGSGVFTCSRCHRNYNNPMRHVCRLKGSQVQGQQKQRAGR